MEARLWARDDRAGIVEAPSLGRQKPSNVLGTLLDRQHPIERHTCPVLPVVGHDNLVVHPAVDKLFQNPQQMIRRHAEHRRTQTAEPVERHDRPIGRE